VSKSIKTREVSSLKNLRKDKMLEILAIEIVEFKIIISFIYRSPNSDVKTFFGLLEEAINRVLNKGRLLVICGEWNINPLQKALLNLLISNNRLNMVQSPMRVTSNTCSLINVMMRNKIFSPTTTNVVEIGYSDHFAHIMIIVLNPLSLLPVATTKESFLKKKKH
jgi:hypothetical protein